MVLHMTPIERAAAALVEQWRRHPHAIIRTDLRRAIEALDEALAAAAAAGQLELAFTHERKLDQYAWQQFLSTSDETQPEASP